MFVGRHSKVLQKLNQKHHTYIKPRGKCCTLVCFSNPCFKAVSIAVILLIVCVELYHVYSSETVRAITHTTVAVNRTKHKSNSNSIAGDLWVFDEHLPLLDRVKSFNQALISLRNSELLSILNATKETISEVKSTAHLVYTEGHGYFKTLQSYKLKQLVTTVFLSLIEHGTNGSLGEVARRNLLVTKFYRWTGVKPACVFNDFQKDVMVFDSDYCQPPKPNFSNSQRFEMNQILTDRGEGDIDSKVFGKYDRTVNDSMPQKYLFFMHVFHNVLVDIGAVYMEDKGIRPNACHGTHVNLRAVSNHDEVFVASIPWTTPFYHKVIESLTKMAVVLDFLRANPNIRILLSLRDDYIDEWFKNMGLDPARIITGAVSAKIAYWPRPTSCYEAPLPDLQIMADEYRRFIKRTSTDKTRNSVIYIRRTKFRQFVNNVETEGLTKELATKHGLKFELYADDALPNLSETMYMFYRARVIVAPHGAGLLNMQYARPGTIVVEAVDYRDCCPCFLLMSHILGHRHHVVGSDAGYKQVRVDMSDFRQSVDFHLKFAAKHSDLFPDS